MIRFALAFAMLCACTPRPEPALELRVADLPVTTPTPVRAKGSKTPTIDRMKAHPEMYVGDPGIHGFQHSAVPPQKAR